MPERKSGLFYPDGSFASDGDVRRKLLAQELSGGSRVVRRSDFPSPRNFKEWTSVILRQQKDRKELLGIPEHVSVDIQTTKPILVGLVGDVHAGGAEVDYQRFANDVNDIKSVGGYTITVGDLTDSFFFMPEVGEQIISGDEQVLYMQSALEHLADRNKLLAAWGGDHDMWSKDKSGAHTLYHQFHQKFGAHYLEGVSYLDVNLQNGRDTVTYPFVGSHRHNGYSVYNDAHASLRQYRDEGVGAMVSFTAHNHKKAHLEQTHKLHGGHEVVVHSIALGSYKISDRYSRKKGFAVSDDASLGAFGLILDPDQRDVEVCWTIEDAIKKLARR